MLVRILHGLRNEKGLRRQDKSEQLFIAVVNNLTSLGIETAFSPFLSNTDNLKRRPGMSTSRMLLNQAGQL